MSKAESSTASPQLPKRRAGCLVLLALALVIGGLFWGIYLGLMETPVGSRGALEPWMEELEPAERGERVEPAVRSAPGATEEGALGESE